MAWALPLVVGASVASGRVEGFPSALRTVVIATALLVAVCGVAVVPQLRWRRWRWEVHDEEVDLRHGAVTEVRTVVPMSRVQHVDVRRSLLAQTLGTADVVIHTAAGATTIPLLPEAAAVEVRDRIAALARAPDEL